MLEFSLLLLGRVFPAPAMLLAHPSATALAGAGRIMQQAGHKPAKARLVLGLTPGGITALAAWQSLAINSLEEF